MSKRKTFTVTIERKIQMVMHIDACNQSEAEMNAELIVDEGYPNDEVEYEEVVDTIVDVSPTGAA